MPTVTVVVVVIAADSIVVVVIVVVVAVTVVVAADDHRIARFHGRWNAATTEFGGKTLKRHERVMRVG